MRIADFKLGNTPTYNKTIKFIDGQKECEISFLFSEEASYVDCFVFLQNLISDEQTTKLNFITDFYEQYGSGDKKGLKIVPDEIFSDIADSYFGGFFTPKKGKNIDKSPQMPDEAIIDSIGDIFHMNGVEAINKYPYRIVNGLIKGRSFNQREGTKKGKKENDLWRAKHKNVQSGKTSQEEVEQAFAAFNKKTT